MKESDHVDSFFAAHPDLDNEENRSIVTRVNAVIDQFAHWPRRDTIERHRKFLHHAQGIEYFGLVYGETGRLAAMQHVMEDCDHIPQAYHYYDGTVGKYGTRGR